MLGFFVIPYPNETFYSLVARYARRFSPIGFGLKLLFGNVQLKIRTDLAVTDLSLFLNNSHNVFPFTCNEIFERFTIWPVYRKFIDERLIKRIGEKISLGGKYVSRDLMAQCQYSSAIPLYCPLCNQIQLENNEEFYWNRLHQIPKILVCPIHFCFLERAVSNVIGQTAVSYIFIANEITCPIATPRFCKNEFINEVSSTLKSWLLNEHGSLDIDYRSKMEAMGYIKGTRLDFEKLESDFIEMVGSSTIQQYCSETKGFSPLSKSLIYSYKKFISPVNHAILQTFFRRLSSLKKCNQKSSPFGTGPWICINKVCTSHRKKTIKVHKYHFIKKSKKHMGYFKCNCGFEYSQRINSKGKYEEIRVRQAGSKWEAAARKLLKAGCSKNEVARKLGYTFGSGRRSVEKIFNSKISKSHKNKYRPIPDSKLQEMRESWQRAVWENITHSKLTVIRKNHLFVYDYLIKYDGSWIKSFNYSYRSTTKNREPINSSQDFERVVLKKIKEIIKEFPSETITKSRISIALGSTLAPTQISLPRFKKLVNIAVSQTDNDLAA